RPCGIRQHFFAAAPIGGGAAAEQRRFRLWPRLRDPRASSAESHRLSPWPTLNRCGQSVDRAARRTLHSDLHRVPIDRGLSKSRHIQARRLRRSPAASLLAVVRELTPTIVLIWPPCC